MSIVDIFDFDIRALTFDKINPTYQARIDKEGKGMSGQYSIFAKYNNKPLSLCLTINQFKGGQTSNVDKNKKEFCDINDQQIKFTVGLNPAEESTKKLKEVLKQIEKKLDDNIEYLLSDELKAKNKPFKNYISISNIKPYKIISEDDPDIKIAVEDTEEHYGKFIVKYIDDIKTKRVSTIFESDTIDEDTNEYIKYPSETRAEITKIPIFNKKVRLMFKLVRVWVSKSPSSMCQGKKGYGITYKLQRVHIFDKIKTNEEVDETNWFGHDIRKIDKKDIKKDKEVETEKIKENEKEEEIFEEVQENLINQEEVEEIDNIIEIIETPKKKKDRRKTKDVNSE